MITLLIILCVALYILGALLLCLAFPCSHPPCDAIFHFPGYPAVVLPLWPVVALFLIVAYPLIGDPWFCKEKHD